MKKNRILSKLKRILIAILCVITLFFSMPVKSSADAGILESIASFILLIPDGIQQVLNMFVSDETEDVELEIRVSLEGADDNDSGTLYNFEVTPYDIFAAGTKTDYGKYQEALKDFEKAQGNIEKQNSEIAAGGGDAATVVQSVHDATDAANTVNETYDDISSFTTKSIVRTPLLDANFFKDDTGDSSNSSDILRPVVANVYKNLKNFVLVLMLVILLYIGIRIIISSAAAEQVKYKQYLRDWVVGICLVFLMQYVMSAIMNVNQIIIDMLSDTANEENYVIAFGPVDSDAAAGFNNVSSAADRVADPFKDGKNSDNQFIKVVSYIGDGASWITQWYPRLKAKQVSEATEATGEVLNKFKDGWEDIENEAKSDNDLDNFINRKLLISKEGIISDTSTWNYDKKAHTVEDLSYELTGEKTKVNAAIYNDKYKAEDGNIKIRALYYCNIAEYCRTITTFSSKYTHLYSNGRDSVMSNGESSEENNDDSSGTIGENDVSSAAFWGYAFLYLLITIETVVFLYKYLKRVLWLAFLTMIAPLIALMYPVDKVGDGKAQTFNMWFKEYLFNTLIQPLHLLLYTVFLGLASQLITTNVIYGIVAYTFMLTAEKFFKKMFGFDKASTPGGLGSPAAGMMAMRGLDRLGGWGPHGKGGKAGGKSEKTSSKIPLAKGKLTSPTAGAGVSGTPESSGAGSMVGAVAGAGTRRGGTGGIPGAAGALNVSSSMPNASGGSRRRRGSSTPLGGLGRALENRFAMKISGGKTGSLGQAFTGQKKATLKTGAKFLARNVGKGVGLVGGSLLGAGVGAVSGALASALTGEDKFADALQKGVLTGGAVGFSRGGQLVDSAATGIENLYDEAMRNSALDSDDPSQLARAGKIRTNDFVQDHIDEFNTLSPEEYNQKVAFLNEAFKYTDSISDMDQVDRMMNGCSDANGNIDFSKLATSIENEKAIKKFGDPDVDKNYNALLNYNTSQVDVSGVELTEEEKNQKLDEVRKQNMAKRDQEIKEIKDKQREIADKRASLLKGEKNGAEISRIEAEYGENSDIVQKLKNDLKYARQKSTTVTDDQKEQALKEALEGKQKQYRIDEGKKKTDAQTAYSHL